MTGFFVSISSCLARTLDAVPSVVSREAGRETPASGLDREADETRVGGLGWLAKNSGEDGLDGKMGKTGRTGRTGTDGIHAVE